MYARRLKSRDLETNTFEKNAGSHSEQRKMLNHNEFAVKDSAEFTGIFGCRLAFWSQN